MPTRYPTAITAEKTSVYLKINFDQLTMFIRYKCLGTAAGKRVPADPQMFDRSMDLFCIKLANRPASLRDTARSLET